MWEIIKDYCLIVYGVVLYEFLFRRSCYWPKEKIQKWQFKKLRKLLLVCEKNIPYYRDLFHNIGFDVSRDFKRLDDLKKVPITTKDVLKAKRDEFVNPAYVKSAIEHKTSGSTGAPLSALVNNKQWAIEEAMVWRHWDWIGYKFRDRMAIVRSFAPKDGKLIRWDHVRNFIYYSPFHLSDDNMKKYLEHMVQYKVKFLRGYPSSVKELACFALKTNCPVPELRGILVASEVLSDEDRGVIERAFNCEVSNWYGLVEGAIAMGDCSKHEGMHVFEEYGYLELLDTGDETRKRIIATNLNNYAMPLLRYDTGDIAQYDGGMCSCGRTSRVVRNVVGRSSDVIKFRDRAVPLTNFYTVMEKYKTIDAWQLVQRSSDAIELIVHGDIPKDDEERIKEEFQQRIPEDAKFSIIVNGEFIRKAEGKKTAFVSVI